MPLPPLVTSPRHWLLGPAYAAQRAPLDLSSFMMTRGRS